MELRHLRYFVAVAEELHFGRAARRLNISQPPLSIQIRNLEQELGVALFIRKRDVELTPAGREFFTHATNVLLKVQQAVESARRVEQGTMGELGVGFMSSMAYTYLPWQLRLFRERFPGIQLTLSEQDTINQLRLLRDGDLDVGIVRGPIRSRGITSVRILAEPLVAALPANHPKASAKRVAVGDLIDDFFIVFPRRIGGSLNEEVNRLCEQAGFTPKVAQEVIQLHVVVSLVSTGMGIAIVPDSTRLFPAAGVVFKRLIDDGAQVSTEIVYRDDDSSRIIQEFIAIARSVAAKGVAGIERLRA